MRADAERSRRRILDAARDVFLERGLDAPLDVIVRRAGVGSATLYRRYADRETLIRDLVGDLLTRVAEAAEQARLSDGDAFAAVRRFIHAAADIRIGAVMPVLLEGLVLDEELVGIRTAAVTTVDSLITAAQEAGTLRRDVGMGDLVLLSIRLSRPLTGSLAALDADGSLLHRHLDLALDGLGTAAPAPADAAPLSFADLIATANRPHVEHRAAPGTPAPTASGRRSRRPAPPPPGAG